eukprot:3795495-Rhodomonas_salina.2
MVLPGFDIEHRRGERSYRPAAQYAPLTAYALATRSPLCAYEILAIALSYSLRGTDSRAHAGTESEILVVVTGTDWCACWYRVGKSGSRRVPSNACTRQNGGRLSPGTAPCYLPTRVLRDAQYSATGTKTVLSPYALLGTACAIAALILKRIT